MYYSLIIMYGEKTIIKTIQYNIVIFIYIKERKINNLILIFNEFINL